MIMLGSIFCVCLFLFFIYFYFLRNAEFQKSEKNIEDLPEDLLLEIFSRVPAASLVSASKVWKALIKDGRFAKQTSQIIMLIDFRVYLASIDLRGGHDNVVEVTSQFSLKDGHYNSSEEVNIREVFHCDGLLLCTTVDNRLVVWNPCSGETSWIKPRSSYEKLDIYALGKPSCNKYNILRIALDLFGGILKPRLYEIYDFTSNSWRVVDDETRDWSILGLGRRGTSVDGNTYWLASGSSQHSPRWMDILLSFDFSTERFGSVSLPVDVLSYNVIALSVIREEQKLCLLATRDDNGYEIDVWIATKIEGTGSAMSWRKLVTVERAYKSQFLVFCTGMSFLADQENKVLVCPGRYYLNSNSFLHIVGRDKYIQVDHHDAGSRCSLLLSYVPSLVQIE